MSEQGGNNTAVKTAKRGQGLGRGLSALFAETGRDEAGKTGKGQPQQQTPGRTVQLLDLTQITPHPGQPRQVFNEAALQELADSIAARGVIQPIIVRPVGDDRYEIVAGERRWRAAQRAQLHRIPAIIRDFDETETLEIAIIENIQREELNPLEEAQAYRKLVGQFGHSQDALGKLVGKSRSHVANLMRLLDLPGGVQGLVSQGTLSMGHARALIGAADAERLADEVVRKGLSVRDTERLVRDGRQGSKSKRADKPKSAVEGNADVAVLERDLGDLLGMKVTIQYGEDGRGNVSVQYSTLDQLDMLCQRLSGEGI